MVFSTPKIGIKIMAKKVTLTPKDKFNALQNATHIFAFKEDKTQFRLIDVINNETGCKAVVQVEDDIVGLFTDSESAKAALNEVIAVFGDDQPLITVNMRETRKGASVYFVEVV